MTHSRLRSAGIESMKPRAPSGIAALTKCWSRSLFRRIEMIVPHCDSTPSARSDGRWVIRPSDTPYLRSEEHTSELQSLMRISYAVLCLKKKKITNHKTTHH